MDGDAGGLEIAVTQHDLDLNLGFDEYLTAVHDQPKPLVIPLCAELPLPQCSPPDVFTATRTGSGFLLESIEGSEKIARYSFIGINPACVITCAEDVQVDGHRNFVSIAREPEGANPVDRIRSILSRFHYVNVKAPRFFGGMVGYFAYDIVHALFRQVKKPYGSAGPLHPDARFMLTKDCIVFDHCDRKLFVFSSPFLTYESDPAAEYRRCESNIRALARKIAAVPERKTAAVASDPVSHHPQGHITDNTGQDAFEHSVARIQEHIKAGDIFQAVLSRRMECQVNGDPFPIYTALREINPSPYLYFLDFGDEQIIGASPEMFVRVERRRVTTVPIAGTRPRGKDPAEDKRLGQELLFDKKERAEHTMLVDLARNDLGRVCKFGSIEVPEFMGIEKFSHVQHIVSTVNGVLNDHLDCYDALKSCFPAGTVSGAPKIRAMQIIGETEPDARGLYAGAVGYIGFDRNLEFAIAIRTVIVRGGRAHIQVGAGIVADSVPKNEWEETENKAEAMMRAIERAGVAS
jgi:anthranilate synthase component 1